MRIDADQIGDEIEWCVTDERGREEDVGRPIINGGRLFPSRVSPSLTTSALVNHSFTIPSVREARRSERWRSNAGAFPLRRPGVRPISKRKGRVERGVATKSLAIVPHRGALADWSVAITNATNWTV